MGAFVSDLWYSMVRQRDEDTDWMDASGKYNRGIDAWDNLILVKDRKATGKTRKLPSKRGKELGIHIIEREYNGRIYQSVTYNQSAQEYVVGLIRKLVEKV